MDLILIVEQTLNGLQLGVMLFLLAAGLTLVFGIMNLVNLAHGALYMVGAYLTTYFFQATGSFELGVVLGLGLFNKIGVLWLGAGLAVGLVATPLRRSLLRPGPWLAGALAAVIASPYVLWQVENGWPTREFIRNATGSKMAAVAPIDFVAHQVDMMSPFTLPLWAAGFLWLFFAFIYLPFVSFVFWPFFKKNGRRACASRPVSKDVGRSAVTAAEPAAAPRC